MPHLSIGALGPLVVTLDGQAVTALAYDKVWALLVYLAYTTDHPHRRESLAGLLWPNQPEPKARTNLRQALYRLRKTLGDGAQAMGDSNATPPFLLVDNSGIQFNAAAGYTLDATEFTALLSACATHSHRHAETCTTCAERREQAIALYRGRFLDKFYIGDSDLFEEWATLMREPLHQQALEAMAALVAYHERRGSYAQALQYSERQLELDPWREEAYRQLMRLLALNGQRNAALHCYERCRTTLHRELGVAPSTQTTALYEQIRGAELHESVKTDYLALPTKRGGGTHWVLPLHPTPFIGRQQELATLADLLADPQCRLVTLVGPGGSGKTHLALQAACEEGEGFADGAAYVSLASLNTAEFIVPTVAAALNLTLATQTAPQTELLRYLRQKEMLLVLDNFEHLLVPPSSSARENGNGRATGLLSDIMRQAPDVTLLVTSRERLHIHGEWVFEVDGLETPPQPYRGGEEAFAQVERYSAVALFLQTARRVQTDFRPTAADISAIVRICQLVQGMPLALELAAAWVRALSCREIAQEIEQSLGFLTTTLRDLPERHRSLQAVFDHSWKLLSFEEQRVFACCSVFRGGFTRTSAAEVTGASLALLAALVDKSLLRRRLNGRYEIHELARQYGADRLVDLKQVAQTRHRHLLYFMRFAEAAEPHIREGEQAVEWHEWMESEHDNVRAALEWSLAGGEIEPGLRIVGAVWEFWMNRGHAPEGQTQAERFLAQPETAAYPYLRGKVVHTAAICAFYQGHYRAALPRFVEAAAIGRELGASGKDLLTIALLGHAYTLSQLDEFDAIQPLSQEALQLGEELQTDWMKGDALCQLANLAWQRGDYTNAHQLFLESVECFKTSYARGYVLQGLGTMLGQQGDYAAAHAYFRQGLAIFEELGDNVRGSAMLTRLGRLAMVQDNDRDAEEYLTKALRLIRETGHLNKRIEPLNALGRLAQRQGDYARARTLHQESLALCIELEHPIRLARTLVACACLAARQGQAETAARLFGAAEADFTAAGAQLDPLVRIEHAHWMAVARTQLGEKAFAAAWAAGAALTLEEAVSNVSW